MHSQGLAYDARMLRIVPQADPGPRQAVIERVKKASRVDGMLQCPRCGSRTMITKLVNSAFVANGRRSGTEIDKELCAECYKQGIKTPMRTEIKLA